MLKKISMSLVILLCLLVSSAQASSIFWDCRVYITDNQTQTFGWTASTDGNGQPVDGYEFRAWNFETNRNWYYNTTSTTITIARPRAGMYKFYVRAYKGESKIYSEWAASDNPNLADIWVDNVFVKQGGWAIYWRLTPPPAPH